MRRFRARTARCERRSGPSEPCRTSTPTKPSGISSSPEAALQTSMVGTSKMRSSTLVSRSTSTSSPSTRSTVDTSCHGGRWAISRKNGSTRCSTCETEKSTEFLTMSSTKHSVVDPSAPTCCPRNVALSWKFSSHKSINLPTQRCIRSQTLLRQSALSTGLSSAAPTELPAPPLASLGGDASMALGGSLKDVLGTGVATSMGATREGPT
mmetsp:Transcript_31768/g.78755  ORF Transcript_31768/g.78755 Transcript_31768/m.78755 type:complete len:209 (+) Transcript_31768:1602-2228(+)